MLDIAPDQGVDRLLRVGGRVGDHLLALPQHLAHLERDDGDQQIPLVPVVVVDRADRHLRRGGDGLDLHVLIALLTEQPARRLDDAVVADRLLLLPEA